MTAYIQIKDKDGVVVANTTTDSALNGYMDIYDVNLWWPYLMDQNQGQLRKRLFQQWRALTLSLSLLFPFIKSGYLYTFEVNLQNEESEIIDIYRLKIGVRSLAWDDKQFLINGRPIYFRGFGKHEDSDVTKCKFHDFYLSISIEIFFFC